jgi:NAD-specific glutamate dehydrogenase
VLDLAERAKAPADQVARDFFTIGRASGLFDLIRWIDEQQPDAYYDALAYRSLRRELDRLLQQLVLKLIGKPGDAEARLAGLQDDGRPLPADRVPEDQLGPAALMVVARQLRQRFGLQ